jgi:nickel/cobalt transporter regulator
MRKALIGILMAATMATPLWAAPGERYQRREHTASQDGDNAAPARAEHQAQRAERQAERQVQRVERQAEVQPVVRERPQRVETQAQAQQGWQGRSNRGNGQSQQSWRGRGDGAGQQTQQSWQGRSDRGNAEREAYRRHIEETRAASAASAAGGSAAIQRKAAQNQARYEDRLREQRRDRRDDRQDWRSDRRDGRQDWRSDRRDGRSSWNRGWRNDNRYDWQRYRYSNRDIFRIGGYYSPYRNHRYSRLSIGLFLGSLFYSDRYWIGDPWQYRLPPAYEGTRWVRYYNDVLLIDLYTGEVIDVIYDFFW